MIKEQLIETVKTELTRKHRQAITLVQQLQESLFSESKSSAGDKHETARAMVQIELEQASKQLKEVELLINNFEKIKTISRTSIGLGSLIETNLGWFYLSIPLGKVQVDQKEVFCLGQTAPISNLLLQQKVGDVFSFGAKSFQVLTVY
jgi:ElaB/YqjD/DUF883 family membrane-anchored ribosome-binding protein